MIKVILTTLLLILVCGIAPADVYKWVDKSGNVHYGDTPPKDRDTEQMEVPDVPTQEMIDRSRKQMHENIDRYRKLTEETSSPVSQDLPFDEEQTPEVDYENIACFTQLSTLAHVPSVETYTPITPTLLNEMQQGLLNNLFSKAKARWRGTITELRCSGSPSQPGTRVIEYEARTTFVEWAKRISQLTLEVDSTGKKSGVIKQLIQRFEVGDALFYSDTTQSGSIALRGNAVELLSLNRDMLSFLFKRRIPSGPHTTRLVSEVLHMEVTDSTLKLIELFFHNGMLTGSTIWILQR